MQGASMYNLALKQYGVCFTLEIIKTLRESMFYYALYLLIKLTKQC